MLKQRPAKRIIVDVVTVSTQQNLSRDCKKNEMQDIGRAMQTLAREMGVGVAVGGRNIENKKPYRLQHQGRTDYQNQTGVQASVERHHEGHILQAQIPPEGPQGGFFE